MESLLRNRDNRASIAWRRALLEVVDRGLTGAGILHYQPNRVRSYSMARIAVSSRFPIVGGGLYGGARGVEDLFEHARDAYENTLRYYLELDEDEELTEPCMFDMRQTAKLLVEANYAPLKKAPHSLLGRWQLETSHVVHAFRHLVGEREGYVNLTVYIPVIDAILHLPRSILLYAFVAHHLALSAGLLPGMVYITAGRLYVGEMWIERAKEVALEDESTHGPTNLGPYPNAQGLLAALNVYAPEKP